jgi:hypothetical protein
VATVISQPAVVEYAADTALTGTWSQTLATATDAMLEVLHPTLLPELSPMPQPALSASSQASAKSSAAPQAGLLHVCVALFCVCACHVLMVLVLCALAFI